jgi:NTP-dependent ternary system trypsin peptidase co-occuring protein
VTELMRFETDSGSIVVEVPEGEPGFELVSRDGVIADTRMKLESALHDVRDAAESTLRVFRDGRARPDGIEVEFGIKLNAEAGVVIAKSSVEGHFTVKLSWSRSHSQADDEARPAA